MNYIQLKGSPDNKTTIIKSGLNDEQVSLTRPIYIEKCILARKQVVLIARVVLSLSGL